MNNKKKLGRGNQGQILKDFFFLKDLKCSYKKQFDSYLVLNFNFHSNSNLGLLV